ncbi:hypothetical protein BJV38_002146 [Clostridium beijerinckii]|nr:hypothetical protein [Clostridium beijerinckii]NRT45303.1 hypothetical protein [Clostridium beijerinckii]NRZ20700.1 hypothetical protein [Clostridium beijerinckii]
MPNSNNPLKVFSIFFPSSPIYSKGSLIAGVSLLLDSDLYAKPPLEKRLHNALSKARRRVETSFSQLAGQFNITRVLAKSKWGLMLRITLKILTHNLSFVLNTITGNTIHIAQIKHLAFG